MAWSDAARAAAAEVRRRKSTMKVTVTSARGKVVKVSRDLYASKLRRARSMSREFRTPGEKKFGASWNKHVVRPNAGAYAAATSRGDAKSRRRRRMRAAGQNPFVRR